MAISLYRKYRPQRFQDVVGQEHIERTLCNAISEGNVSHAYLFCGPRGTGKTTTARLLAKALLCEKGPTVDPCGICDSCSSISTGSHPDVYELDAASRTGVDNVREEIIGRVPFAPTHGAYKVYIIDEVHMLSIPAFNALLKTLEEPPSHVVFILCTTDPQKIPETILSRCQRFDFRRISVPDIMKNLRYICDKEGFAYDDASLELIAKHASGGMRDAITSLEQLAVFSKGAITYGDAEALFGEVEDDQLFDLVDLIAARDVAGCFHWIDRFSEGGTDYMQLTHDLTAHTRNVYVTLLSGGKAQIDGVGVDELKRYEQQAATFGGSDRLSRMLALLGELSFSLKQATDARLAVEVALTRMARPDSDLTLASLAERVEALEQGRVATMSALPMQQTAPVVQETVQPAPEAEPAQTAAQAVSPADDGASASSVSGERPAQVEARADEAAAAGANATDAAPSQAASAPSASQVDRPQTASAATAPQAASTPDAPQATTSAALQAAPQAAVSAAGALDAATVQRMWGAVMKAVKAHRRSLVGAYATVAVKPDAPDGIVAEFPYGNDFSKTIAEEHENHMFIEQALEQAAGRKVPFRCTIAKAKSGKPAAAQPKRASDAAASQPTQPVAAPSGQPTDTDAAPAVASREEPRQDSSSVQASTATGASASPAPRTPVPPAPAPIDPSGVYADDEDDLPPVSGVDLSQQADSAPPARQASVPAQVRQEPAAPVQQTPSPRTQQEPAASAQQQTPIREKAETVVSQPASPQPQREPAGTPEAQSAHEQTTDTPNPEEQQLEQLLQTGFGTGIQVEEVKEDHVEQE